MGRRIEPRMGMQIEFVLWRTSNYCPLDGTDNTEREIP